MSSRRVLQIVAVASSLVLGGGFVFVKAGGVIPGLPFNVPEKPKAFSSSKVMILDALPAEVMSGSKSFSGTTAIQGGKLESAREPLAPPPNAGDLLPGSKSLISPIIPDALGAPAHVLPGFKSTVIAPSASVVHPTTAPPTPGPDDAAVFHGTKSAPIIDPVVPDPSTDGSSSPQQPSVPNDP